ncbi:Hpt domain-containing protein [Pseudomonas sp. EpS/L25]|uniref:Hpt domain-containing protein n=1 Tax=Pseudomonas sp. EpS/L25 TaxID=1749078 RepID=UPI000744472E|nr:Hpt domain-containing protein [Pseudomonas sp. EpS/L25]KUM42433.1 hybrid sensor histidine kinase/response regulator [Pseudomonas sp. EpS/L25]
MIDRHDYVALEWVKGEIAETLQQARKALEAFVDNPQDRSRLGFCRTYVHQVYGTLQMVEFYGAALLAEEMELLLQELHEGRVSSPDEALEVLMQAILQVPPYLDRVLEARRDLPLAILPLLNDLRSARGEKLLSETSLFSPDFSAVPLSLSDAELADRASPDWLPRLRKLRQALQGAQVGLFRDRDVHLHLDYLLRVFERLDQLCAGSPFGALWPVAAGLTELLKAGELDNSSSIRGLLRQLDRELKRLISDGVVTLNQPAPADLLKNLLFYLAKAPVQSPRIAALKAHYRLDEALPDAELVGFERSRIVGPDREAMRSVVTALCEELVQIKDNLDLFVRSDRQQVGSLRGLLAPLKQIADTLAVLGFGQPRKVVLEQHEAVGELAEGVREANDAALMDIAGALLYVEATLAGMVSGNDSGDYEENRLPTTDIDQLHRVVVREARNGLEQSKDAIIEFIASQWNHVHLEPVPLLLTQVRGGLAMIPLERAAAQVQAANDYICEQLLGKQAVPDWQSLDTLADAITSVEYYLERLAEDPSTPHEMILDIADESLIALGYPARAADEEAPAELSPPASPAGAPALDAAAVDEALPPAADTAMLELDALPDETLLESPPVSEEPSVTEPREEAFELTPIFAEPSSAESGFEDESLALAPADEPAASPKDTDAALPDEPLPTPDVDEDAEEPEEPEELLAGVELDQLEPLGADSDSVAEVLAAPVDPINPPAAQVPHALLPPPADAEPIEDELREVFIEEAGEVQAELERWLPTWHADPEGRSALAELRRNFHTLKGSGRMVQALVIGELAWAVENLLNRRLDHSVDHSAALQTVVDDVCALLPELVTEYAEDRQRQRDDVDWLAHAAHALARNEALPERGAVQAPAPVEVTALPLVEVADVDSAALDEAFSEADNQLLDIFRTEAQAHLETVRRYLEQAESGSGQVVSDALLRALHTLKGSAHMAGSSPVAELASALERLAKEYKLAHVPFAAPECELLARGADLLEARLAILEDGSLMEPLTGAPALIAECEALLEQLGEELPVPEVPLPERRDVLRLADFLMPAMDMLLDADERLVAWRTGGAAEACPDLLAERLNTFADRAARVGLVDVEQLAEALQAVYAAVASGSLPADEAFFREAEDAQEALISMLNQLASGTRATPCDERIEGLRALLVGILAGLPETATALLGEPEPEAYLATDVAAPFEPAAALDLELSTEAEAEAEAESEPEAERGVAAETEPESEAEPDVAIEAELLSGAEAEKLLEQAEAPVESAPDAADDVDREMQLIFLEEALDLLDSADRALERWLVEPQQRFHLGTLQRDLHTLKGGANLAGIAPVAALATELDAIYEGLLDGRLAGGAELGAPLRDAHACLATQLEELENGASISEHADEIERLQRIRAGHLDELTNEANEANETPSADLAEPSVEAALDAAPPVPPMPSADGPDAELLAIYVEESRDLLDSMATSLRAWEKDPRNGIELESLLRDLHTLKGGARLAEVDAIGDLAHALEAFYEGLARGRIKPGPTLGGLLHRCHDRLHEQLEALALGQASPAADELIEALRDYREQATMAAEPLASPPAVAPVFDEETDAEILEIFTEEAQDLLASMDTALARWPAAPEVAVDELLRCLHTLKGGARLAGLHGLGDQAHDLEQQLAELRSLVVGLNEGEGARVRDLAVKGVDQLQLGVVRLSAPSAAPTSGAEGEPSDRPELPDEASSELVEAAPAAEEPIEEAPDAPVADEPSPLADEASEPEPELAMAPVMVAREQRSAPVATLPFVQRLQQVRQQAAQRRSSQELVRVPAALLEQLVNLAGETSIFRGRVEQQVNDIGTTLGEMEATIERVRDQLRRLDTETQAQIISRHHEDVDRVGYEDFDPLELDRYSQLQQLSRALFESASDLLDLKNTLGQRNRDAETLLLQQARVNTELQESLMQTRMVPFERMVPRLHRVVRQVSGELDKPVELRVGNAEGELDRTVLERIIPPLEHMLRNAIDHGIEDPAGRQRAGKPAEGVISLDLRREGGDIILTLADDGRGIDLDAVRRKAIERGLMAEGVELPDAEVLQFILESGFSTAASITQISGRGVGMDVVHQEVKQLGGSMDIHSVAGEGTRFTIRLPFTVSVNRALMVHAGDDLYAVPLNTIEGIVRVTAADLERFYRPGAEAFEYGGQRYDLRYLGHLLGNGQQPKLTGQSLPLPVVLVRSAEHAVAIQVDAVAGSREIVVKGLGPQFAGVPGLSGATLLGDGRVVVILDLLAMIRSQRSAADDSAHLAQNLQVAVEASRPVLVMVVDDSVTVRKVTSRLLERHGMEVFTAKDGVDAIAQLQERQPDILLLDIEMPRMDGFEVATLVRHDARLKDLPIVMITSRTGEKHRERALSLGVNEYLGKPYQESELLAHIHRLVREHD